MSQIERVKDYYRTHLLARFGKPKGSSNEEVAEIERHIGHPLPGAYKEYLLWMGNDKEGVFRGSAWFASDVARNTEYVTQLLRENNIDWRPDGPILAFFSHQGYMIAWFDVPADDDDPRCYFFSEGKGMIEPREEGRFSEVLLAELEGAVATQRPHRR